jgi:hypothetical protein
LGFSQWDGATTFRIKKLDIKVLFVILSINDTQRNGTVDMLIVIIPSISIYLLIAECH